MGKTTVKWVDSGFDDYFKRLFHYIPFEALYLPSLKGNTPSDKNEILLYEAQLVMKQLQPGDIIVLLDEKGRQHTSEGFANYLQKHMNSGLRRLVFVIGSAYGFHESMRERANDSMALSLMTMPHDMVRTVFIEQLYRAMTIIKGEKYHH